MKVIKSLTILTFILIQLAAYPQAQRTVTGTVYSNDTKQAIQGASIVSKSTGRSIVSGQSGSFIFRNLTDSDTLAISFIGHASKEIPVASIVQSPIDVYLEEVVKQIDEVVVNTGYQSLPRERATGSFTQIGNDLFNRSVSTDLVSRLEGVTNGLAFELPATRGAPSSTPNLRIRGLSTIRGETEPLIVVDNFPYEGDINNINPNDVESITVLKDAAAASIWGARAGNGVIVITTKSGAISRRPTINFNTNVSITQRPDLYYSRDYLSPAETVELEHTLYERGLYTRNDWTAYTPAVEILHALAEERIDEATANAQLEVLKRYDIRDEAVRHLYRQGLNQQYAMNINGGAEWHQYYLSAGFDNNASNLIGNGYERITLMAKNDFQPIPKLNISTSLNYVQGRSTSNGIGLMDLTPIGFNNPYVYARLADENGNALPIVRNNRFSYTDAALEMGLLDWHYRPLDELRLNDNTSNTNEIRVNTSVGYQLYRGLRAEVRYQYQNIGEQARQHYPQESYYARHAINRFTDENGTRRVPLGGILDRSGGDFSSHYGRFQLDYNGDWADRHELNGVAGLELRQERSISRGTSRLYGYNDEVLSYATNLNFDTSFPTRPRLSARIPYDNSPGRHITDRFVSYYANFAYTFDGKYILSGSTRWDASNIFGVDFNQKGVPLWSIGGAWNASDEPFFNVDWVNLAKLRLTYGSNGNAVRSLSSLPFITYGGTNAYTGLPYGILRSVGNPDLSWEQVNTLNIGLDFSLFDRRISGSVDWYNKNSSNLIGSDVFDPTTGISPLSGTLYNLDNQRNYADLNTKGIDIEVNTVNVDRGLKWQTTALFSKVRNTVMNYNNLRTPMGVDLLTVVAAPLIVGNAIDQLYSLPWHGLDGTGAPLVMVNGELGTDYNTYFNDLTQEGVIRAGVTMPPYFGAIRNTFTWRSLSASVNIVWKAGHRFRRGSISYANLFGTSKVMHMDYLDRWQQPGDELTTDVPSMPESTNARRDQAYLWSEATLERGDHIRLQDVNLSYQLPDSYSRHIGLSQVRIYAFASNLGLLWKHTDYDVDPGVSALYPRPIQVSFGLQIQL
ncbi:SusC/RagA family TonB-linked outer membrane protein [Parapedobacter koreensis]|uniref:TonB-linked outer membrane protein, SusC/RagA family n=1 Tax=Parapedobacter koreensis TaxID=332977 RepID=A0A1H7P721_9SPHI|nr:SusC/RagA family TonB-linked outer membrane protein [Parapedobacter koreensis]SEL31045.1 TonB-linked outer membrane protein, SusC/RagA family [Parapedobacter koreensis]